MNLHNDKKLFKEAIQVTAKQLKIAEVFIEKDYWVVYVLKSIFSQSVGESIVFKGGTALSKCFNIIERFSEDIDLVILEGDLTSENQRNKRLKKVTQVITAPLEEVEIEGITNKRGMLRKIAYEYPKVDLSGQFIQARDKIIVEATRLGKPEPFETKKIATYIYDMMLENKQSELIEKYELAPLEVKVLSLERTFCEKIMSLVRFSYGDGYKEQLKNKIRHIYDLNQLLKTREIQSFLNSGEFELFFQSVGQDDVHSFRNENEWLVNHPKEAKLFSNTESVWKEIKSVYTKEFRDLVYGYLPNEEEILQTLHIISGKLNSISWTIKLNQ
ncbi:nucleotidyl transferase AbiEii/AbiGii toxin family protein [Flammeovirga pectinis]|uniref:Nucleotidyl transferase AbiEii/AbiGii toxin family protein n=1 Tax=Flammeovirga pectinis TaxID=2494373 RepID=A0A3Q9FRW4_9BACT|nr:nucleotidyl transferase AbiEii/AbiGii toxin family protein [Flammeovirga pectinis]AZQ63310.1 nucleotidyl transferase AbiEii/AbiGii toxin family protein [Flammeovirga pectinis]